MTRLVCFTLFTLSLTAQPNQFVNLEIIPRMDNLSRGELRFRQARPTNRYVGFKAPAAIAANLIWTLPSADSTGCFQSSGTGIISISTCGATPPFVDTTTIVKGSVDATKLLRFEVDGLSSFTTRTLTPQDASYTIAGLEVVNNFITNQNIVGNLTVRNVNPETASFYSFGATGNRWLKGWFADVDTNALYVGGTSGFAGNISFSSTMTPLFSGLGSIGTTGLPYGAGHFFTMKLQGTLTTNNIAVPANNTYAIGDAANRYTGVHARFANLYAVSAALPGGVFMRTSGAALRASFSADDTIGGEFTLINGAGNQFFAAINGQLRFGGAATPGANSTLSCPITEAIKTITVIEGGVTAVTCGVP